MRLPHVGGALAQPWRARRRLGAILVLLVSLAAGCAAPVQKHRHGVDALQITRTRNFDPEAIKACLATRSRPRFTIGGQAKPECGVPPFNTSRFALPTWAWPWTEWPIFNETAFERDLDRIERWYRARGYYEAVVSDVKLERDDQERRIAIELQVTENEPVLVLRIEIKGLQSLPSELQRQLRAAVELQVGEPFDEAHYDRSKRAMLERLQEASYAKAAVHGSAQVDPIKKLARVEFTLEPGPACRFGTLTVEGNADLPAPPIEAATAIEQGDPFSTSALRDARFAIYALGAFAGVEVEQRPRADAPVIDVLVRVVPAREFRFGVGLGVTSGGVFAQEEGESSTGSFALWDVHLLGRAEHSNFLGGMRRLRIEERPRLIFDNTFPSTTRSGVGNLLTVELRQPGFLEARTTLVARARWDLGPDPYGGRFLRHDLVAGLGPERYFLGGKLLLASSINADLFRPQSETEALFPNSKVGYFYHVARVDLRNDPRNTIRGSYFSLGIQHAGYFLPSDWDYYRITQDSRGYIEILGGLVLALRAQLGFMKVTGTRIEVPSFSGPLEQQPIGTRVRKNLADFGPLRHRLRGGGYNNVRGYAPNTLGDVEMINGRLLSGGLRQWAASAELRVPLTESLGTVLFVDVGDVTRETHYRFYALQTSIGLGFRYHTLVGPVRLDAALAPPGLQVIGTDDRYRKDVPDSHLLGANGAISFTIGEAF